MQIYSFSLRIFTLLDFQYYLLINISLRIYIVRFYLHLFSSFLQKMSQIYIYEFKQYKSCLFNRTQSCKKISKVKYIKSKRIYEYFLTIKGFNLSFENDHFPAKTF